MCATPGATSHADVDEVVRTHSRDNGWRGATGLYRSMLEEGADITGLAERPGLNAPVLEVGAGGGAFAADTMSKAARSEVGHSAVQSHE